MPYPSITGENETMSQTPPSSLTCPAGHTFPYEQLTTRNGLAVCPICDGMHWETPRLERTWSRRVLTSPLVLLIGAIVMFLVEIVSGIGIGAVYQSDKVAGAGWLVAGSAVSLAGIIVVGLGVARAISALRSSTWTRSLLSTPLLVVAIGLAVLAIGDVVELGLNIAFMNESASGAGWQLVAEIFDTLFFAGLAGVVAWVALLTRRPEAAPAAEVTTIP